MQNFYQLRNLIDPEAENQSYELKPLTDEDMHITSAEEIQADMERKKALGINPTKLGNTMSDEEFQKFHGLQKEVTC